MSRVLGGAIMFPFTLCFSIRNMKPSTFFSRFMTKCLISYYDWLKINTFPESLRIKTTFALFSGSDLTIRVASCENMKWNNTVKRQGWAKTTSAKLIFRAILFFLIQAYAGGAHQWTVTTRQKSSFRRRSTFSFHSGMQPAFQSWLNLPVTLVADALKWL